MVSGPPASRGRLRCQDRRPESRRDVHLKARIPRQGRGGGQRGQGVGFRRDRHPGRLLARSHEAASGDGRPGHAGRRGRGRCWRRSATVRGCSVRRNASRGERSPASSRSATTWRTRAASGRTRRASAMATSSPAAPRTTSLPSCRGSSPRWRVPLRHRWEPECGWEVADEVTDTTRLLVPHLSTFQMNSLIRFSSISWRPLTFLAASPLGRM